MELRQAVQQAEASEIVSAKRTADQGCRVSRVEAQLREETSELSKRQREHDEARTTTREAKLRLESFEEGMHAAQAALRNASVPVRHSYLCLPDLTDLL